MVDDLSALTYIDAAVVYNTTYYYHVAAVFAGIESTLSSVVIVKPVLPIPINVKAVDTKQGREIKITWDRPTMDIPLKYTVYRSAIGGSSGGSIASNIDMTEYFDKDVNNGTYYYYYVKSVYNTNIESDPSGAVGAAPSDAAAPGRPSGVRTGTPSSDGKVWVSWSAPGNESNLHYRVFRSSSPSGTGPQITETTDTSFSDTLPPGTGTFYYCVSAFDAAGNESLPSDAARVDMAAPVVSSRQQYKVSGLVAEGTLNQGEIQLRWTMPNYSEIAYSRVYRRLDPAASAGMIADKVYGSSYLDKGVELSKRYYYFVRLVGKDGYEYEAGSEVNAVSFTRKSTSASNSQNRKTTATVPAAVAKPKATVVKSYAYGRSRMTNLKLEAALANNLRKALIKKLGAKKVPARLGQTLIKAYIYGGYNVAEIANTITNGPGLVHPTIQAYLWRRSAEYKRHAR